MTYILSSVLDQISTTIQIEEPVKN